MARWFGFGDQSDWKYRVFPSDKHPDLWHWALVDPDGNDRALPPIRGNIHGFASYEEAEADLREVVNGTGADFKDLEVE